MGGETSDSNDEGTAIQRRDFLGLASVGSLVFLAGCGQPDSSGLSVSEDGRLVVSGVEDINLADGITVVDTEGKSVTVGAANTLDGGDEADATDGSLVLGTGDRLVFGDNEEVTATYDSDTGKLEINGGVQISDGEFKGPYDTNQYVHDLILPGMHAYSTNAVGVQDNVLGYADEWATVSHTEFSDGGNLSSVFKPGPSEWAGWNQPADFPAQVTIEGLSQDFGPGRAMVMFRPNAHARKITIETRTESGAWEMAAQKTGNTSNSPVLNPDGVFTPVTDVRWTFAEPGESGSIRIQNLFYYSRSIKGNTWLPKERGETTGLTFVPGSPPNAPDQGVTLFVDESGTSLSLKRADGSETQFGATDTSVQASGEVTLSEGSAVVPTGVTDAGRHLNVHLDPAAGNPTGPSTCVSSALRWDEAAGEYQVRISEDDTDVGNPTVGYKITTVE